MLWSVQSYMGQCACTGTVQRCHTPGRDAHLAASGMFHIKKKKKKNRKDKPGSHRRTSYNGKSRTKERLQQYCTGLFKAPLTPLQMGTCSEGFSCTTFTKHTSRDRALNGLWFHLSVHCTWCSNLDSSPPHFMDKVLQKHKVSTYQLGKFMVLTPLL